MKQWKVLIASLIVLPSFGQTALRVHNADLAVPFGVASGKLLLVGDYLIFVDNEKPEASLAVTRGDVRNLEVSSEGAVTVETAKPIRDRSGDRSRLVFRLQPPSTASVLSDWYKSDAKSTNAEGRGTPAGDVESFEVKHDHRLGGCNGRLLLEQNRVVFESISDIDHSRQWSLRDIKEMKRDSPYSLKIVPFSGDTYSFELQGKGLDSEVYRGLGDRIAKARTEK